MTEAILYQQRGRVVLTGARKASSGPGNLKEALDRSGSFAGSPAALRDRCRDRNRQTIPRLNGLEVPAIAAGLQSIGHRTNDRGEAVQAFFEKRAATVSGQ